MYIQVGVTAMREPNGEYLPSIPMYIEVNNATNLTHFEDEALTNISGFFTKKLKEREIKRERNEIHA